MESLLIFILLILFIAICLVYFGNIFKVIYNDKILIEHFDLDKSLTNILKGIAIIGIFISHIATHSSFSDSSLDYSIVMKVVYTFMVTLGDIGVSVFFLLSGYGNYKSLENDKDCKEYLRWFKKRMFKIFNTFWLCYLVDVVIIFSFSGQIFTLYDVIHNCITLTMPGTTTWYLKVQLLFYAITLASFCLAQKKSGCLMLVCMLSIIYSAVMYSVRMDVFWWQSALGYTLGMFIAHNEDNMTRILKQKQFLILVGGTIAVVSYVLANIIFNTNYFVRLFAYIIIPFYIISVASLCRPQNHILKRLGGGIGSISFEIYLIHIGLISTVFTTNGLTLWKLITLGILTIMGVVIVRLVFYVFRLFCLKHGN